MARKSRTGVLKRQREVKKAEKAAMKREKREIAKEASQQGHQIATSDDLAGYGFSVNDAEESEAEPPAARPDALRDPSLLCPHPGRTPRQGDHPWPMNR